MFSNKKTCLIINNVVDKNADIIEKTLVKYRAIMTQGHFMKSKSICASMQKTRTVMTIPFFTNSRQNYIIFLLKNLGYDASHAVTVMRELDNSAEDPLTVIEKLASIDFSYETNEVSSSRSFEGMEPIQVIRMCINFVKNSYGKMDFLPPQKGFSDEELLERLLKLEIFYKKNNMRSKMFIQKDFIC